jgi:2,5-furandicarboxylate decarboxylase 1
MDLRSFLKKLEQEKKLTRIKKAVSHEFEAANIIYSLDEQPVLFDQIKGFDFPVFAGITSNRDIIAEGLDTTKEDLLFKLVESLKHPKKPDLVENAPCQKHVIMDPDLSKLPILHHLSGDGGRYLSASVCTIKDPDDGRNVSYHRMMQIGRNKLTARLIKKRQTRTTYDRIDGDLEMAVCLGSSVAVMVAASLGPPSDVDEFSIANALDETPLVKCKTKDLEVPAFSEIVLEGRLTRDLDREGPFVDLTETRDFERQEPVFVVDCITHRDNAMYQALIPGRFEHKTLMGMPKEPTIYNEVSKVADCKNVYVTLGGGSWLHAVVQIKKRHPDEPKKAIDAAFKGHGSLKHVVVVDEDVDIYDSLAVEWAIATRFQADKDLVIKEKQPGSSLDPSGIHVPGEKTKTAKMGLDATIPEHVDKKNYEKVSYKLVDVDDYIR